MRSEILKLIKSTILSFLSAGRMKIPSELKQYIVYPAQSGSDIISSTRAVLYYLVDELIFEDREVVEPFESIDSQTDHIKLDDAYPFSIPSPRVSLNETRLGGLIGSSVRDPAVPGDPGYNQEIQSIFEFFVSIYNSSVKELFEL